MSTPQLKRFAAIVAVSLATAFSLAQQPLVTPHYLTFNLPELEPGAALEGELTTADGQNFKDGSRLDIYSVVLAAGESASVRVVSTEFEPVVSVYDPSGYLLAFSDLGQDYGDVTAAFSASDTGRHIVVVSGWSDLDLGAYTVSRTASSSGSSSASPISIPAVMESQLTLEMTPLPHGFGGVAEYFSFDIAEETLLLAAMSASDFDAYLTLYGPDGSVIAENDDDGYSTDSMLVALLEPGSYVIAASSYFAGQSGAYTLTLEPYFRR